ncbi:hypothetical protein D3C87_1625120 [compost metagenome]
MMFGGWPFRGRDAAASGSPAWAVWGGVTAARPDAAASVVPPNRTVRRLTPSGDVSFISPSCLCLLMMALKSTGQEVT